MRTPHVLLAGGAALVVVIATIGTAAADPGQPTGSGPTASGGPGTQNVTAARAAGLPESGAGSLALGPGVSVEVTIRVAAVSDETRRALAAAGAQITVVSAEASSYAADIAPKDLNAVAAVPGVIAVSEVLQPWRPDPGVRTAAPKPAPAVRAITNACAPTTSLANTQLQAALARTNFGVDGTGIKVGVISSSYAATTSPTSAAQDVASGNLPGTGNPCGYPTPVQVLSDDPSGLGDDEGRAMLQLVHKVAPGATLMFAHGSGGNPLVLADSVRAMQAAGANVIVDDIGTAEPMFQASIVDKAISDVTALGVTYLAAAGNLNQAVGTNDVGSIELSSFRPTACPAVVAAYSGVPANSCMDFSPSDAPGHTPSNSAWYSLAPGFGQVVIEMGFSEPLYGVTDNLHTFLISEDENTILDKAEVDNIATGLPLQPGVFYGKMTGPDVKVKVVVSRVTGSGTPRVKTNMVGSAGLNGAQYPASSGLMTVGPSIYGHNGGADTFSIAATPGPGAAPPNPAIPPVPPPPFPPVVSGVTPESYSSRGPVTYYWGPFTTAATPAAAIPATVLNKPDVTSTDGDCTTFGPQPDPPSPLPNCPYQFYGTSGASPNAAGVAALVLSRNNTLTSAQVKAIMVASAAPMSGGSLFSTGAGLLDANAAVGLVPTTPAPPPTSVVVQAQGPLNGCVTAPKRIPRHGKRKLQKLHCTTNAGQPVTVVVTGRLRGDTALWKVIHKKNGAVFIKTYGRHLKLRITWTAPATAGYAAYAFTRTYRT